MVVTTTAVRKMGKKSKRPNKGPSRTRYWNGRHLERNKVRHMMKAYGLTKERATLRWNAERTGRIPTGYVHDYTDGKANTHKKSA